jgi:hypothetical protein
MIAEGILGMFFTVTLVYFDAGSDRILELPPGTAVHASMIYFLLLILWRQHQ